MSSEEEKKPEDAPAADGEADEQEIVLGGDEKPAKEEAESASTPEGEETPAEGEQAEGEASEGEASEGEEAEAEVAVADDSVEGTGFVPENLAIGKCIKTMVEKDLTNLLVINNAGEVIGIVTERDIVRRFSLLDVKDKENKKIITIASRPVKFIRSDHMAEDLQAVLAKEKIRHFPLVEGKERKKENIVGILDIAQVAAMGLLNPDEGKNKNEEEGATGIPLKLIVSYKSKPEVYMNVFRRLGYQVEKLNDIDLFFREHGFENLPLFFDLDGFEKYELQKLIPIMKKYKGPLVIVTANAQMVGLFRPYLDDAHQSIMVKPLDFSYCHYLYSIKWSGEQKS